jgi:hypothetical protein
MLPTSTVAVVMSPVAGVRKPARAISKCTMPVCPPVVTTVELAMTRSWVSGDTYAGAW